MFIAIKLVLYIIAAHIFFTHGFDPNKKLMEFVTLMSCVLLMDIVSYSSAKFSVEKEINESKKSD